MNSIHVGTIVDVIPPNHKMNLSKYQFEYNVNLNLHSFSHAPVKNAVRLDQNGFIDNYEDMVLGVGSVVLVSFISGKRTAPVIIGSLRHYSKPMTVSAKLNQYWKKRYNKFELSINDTNNFTAKSDSGPYVSINTDKIALAGLSSAEGSKDTEVEENLILDKKSKTVTINTKDLVTNIKNNSKTTIDKDSTIEVKENVTIKIKGNVSITVDGDVTLKCKNLKAEVKESCEVKTKELKAKVSGAAEVNASRSVTIKSPEINLNGGGSGVTTSKSHYDVVDFITGIPCLPSTTIKGDI